MDSVSIELWLDKRQLAALEQALAEDGTTVDRIMQERLDELYAQRVPPEQQEKIQQELDAEQLESQRSVEANTRYAGFHITENGQEHYLSTKSGQEFLDMAILMRRYVRGTFGDKEKDSPGVSMVQRRFHLSGLSSWPHGGWRISAKSPVWWRSTLTKEFSPPSILWMAGRASGSKMCPPPPTLRTRAAM